MTETPVFGKSSAALQRIPGYDLPIVVEQHSARVYFTRHGR
ncbi:MAG: hypothetical protein ACJASV_000461 [Pseudorhodobacter sp.]|jgi:hypothetical protein